MILRMKAFASILFSAALLTGCGDSSEGTQDKSSDNDTSQVPGTYTFSPKEGDSKPAITFVLKDDKSFTAEERSDKFRGTWKVEGSDVILEGIDAEKGGDDQGGEDIGVRFDAKTYQLKSITDDGEEIMDKILKRAGKDTVHLKKEA